jgi:hypothetical protein
LAASHHAAREAATTDRTQRALTFRPGSKDPGAIEPDTPDLALWLARLAATFGGCDVHGQLHLLDQLARVFWQGEPHNNANAAVALVQDIAPRTGTEAMLAVQMVAVHNTALEQLRRAMLPDQPSVIVDSTANRATRLLRLFADQVAALQKLRGPGSNAPQTVNVRFVQVEAGGQAIVGAVAAAPQAHDSEAE